MWKCRSLRRSGRRIKRRGVGDRSETCSQRSAAVEETEAALVSMVFPAAGGKPKSVAVLSRTAFSEAQAVEVKVGVQNFTDRLQRPHRLPFGFDTLWKRKKHSCCPPLSPESPPPVYTQRKRHRSDEEQRWSVCLSARNKVVSCDCMISTHSASACNCVFRV